MQKAFRRTLITGLLIILPVLVSVWVIRFIFSQLDRAVTPFVLQLIRWMGLGRWIEAAWVDYLAPLVSVCLAVLVVYLLGLVGENVIGRQLLKQLDRLLMQVPFVRGIYSATRKFLDTFSGTGTQAFSRVVMVEYPRQGLWTLALLTGKDEGEVRARAKQELVSVFVPTTPNPTSGWLLYVPIGDVITLDMSVDDAFKLIISGGVLTPPYEGDNTAKAASSSASLPAEGNPEAPSAP